jgi:tetratricopeptide (TPR) repeat protein
MAATESSIRLHLGIAEQGKLLALKGKHEPALSHYREALRMAVSSSAPEVFFRHYTQCVMESLERSGTLDAVLRYCDEAEAHYQSLASPLPLVARDRAENHQRRASILLRMGRKEEAIEALEQALATAGTHPLPLAREVLGWIRRGLDVGARQLDDAQRRHMYYIVRKELVDPARAIALPPERLQAAGLASPL